MIMGTRNVGEESVLHAYWLSEQTLSLLSFGRASSQPNGVTGWLNSFGELDEGKPTPVYMTARMLHVYALGTLLGVPGSRPIAEGAVRALLSIFQDPVHNGWFSSLERDGTPKANKMAYDHSFVLMASASAVAADISQGATLLERAESVFLDRFWDDDQSLCRESWDEGFTKCDEYRGLNANMHAVEAMLSVASVTGSPSWVERALRVCRFAADMASRHGWLLPEHFDAAWNPILDFNKESPRDQFRPYGATIGHGFEWSRLFLHAEAISQAEAPWLLEASTNLFKRSVSDGWAPDGYPGFVYTVDWNGAPVITDRLHWVLAEAIGAASALYSRTGQDHYKRLYFGYWDHADRVFIDHAHGSWHHETSPEGAPSSRVWDGKPDLYHAVQATLIPRLPLDSMLAGALLRKRVGKSGIAD